MENNTIAVIHSLKEADILLKKDADKGIKLINSTYGKIGPACYAVHAYLTSDAGKTELKEANETIGTWVSKRGYTDGAFRKAVSVYKASIMTPEEKQAKSDKAKADKVKRDAEKAKQAVMPEFGTLEVNMVTWLKAMTDDQINTLNKAVVADMARRTAESALIIEADSKGKKGKKSA